MGVSIQKELKKQIDLLKFGVSEIVPEIEFVQMLKQSLETGVPLRVKCGIDPTSSSMHLGHSIPYKKMRQFQDLGHQGIVIIGDYTAGIGDPTGRNQSRPSLDKKTIEENAQSYMEQVYKVIRSEKTEIRYQSEWFQNVSLKEAVSWMSQTTMAKLLGHETFKQRLNQGDTLCLHELFYPVLQGIDSVYVEADVELGGVDQRFNVLMARDYQKNKKMRPQTAMLLPIITGTCGVQKMSKTLDNTINILDRPFDKFGKVMSIPDSIMLEYYQNLTEITPEQFVQLQDDLSSEKLHLNEAKKQLAVKIVSFYHGDETGHKMKEEFENVFKRKQIPDVIPEFSYKEKIPVLDLLTKSNLVSSKKEAKRMIVQGALSIVGEKKITDEKFIFSPPFNGRVIKLGKRKFLKLTDGKELAFHLFSDGACRGNPGWGAWGIVAEDDGGKVLFENAGVEEQTTNNRMELRGAIEVLKQFKQYALTSGLGECFHVTMTSDSKYVIEGISKWVPSWKKRGWRKADNKIPQNLDLWKELDHLCSKFTNLHFSWVKGHDNHPQNEQCDYLANRALDRIDVKNKT